MAKILVTGGNGFLGSWLVKSLSAEGHQVTLLVRPSSRLTELQGSNYRTFFGDVTDSASVNNACQGQDFVFHLAGCIAYRKADREKMNLINVEGTRNVVAACLTNKTQRLVHLSSVVAVGAGLGPKQILNENSEYNLSHLNLGYFETKRAAEKIVVDACQSKSLDAVILNPSTIYGPGDALKGSRKTQLKVAQGKFPFYTGGGVSVVPVDNCVQGILAGWQKGRSGERYILSADNLTIKELFETIAEAAGCSPPKTLMPGFVLHLLGIGGDLMTSLGKNSSLSRENAWTATLFHWFDSAKAQRELGFKPGSAREAIRRSVGWMKEQGMI